jgi:DNA-binding LacI/PurR family transcriptional regulator
MALVSFDDPKLPFELYIHQGIDTITGKAVELIIEQMEGRYVPRRETMPFKSVADVGYPTPEGL